MHHHPLPTGRFSPPQIPNSNAFNAVPDCLDSKAIFKARRSERRAQRARHAEIRFVRKEAPWN